MEGLGLAQIIQFAMSAIFTIGMAIFGWFVSKIFDEIKKSRDNERELYRAVGEGREDLLKLHIELLKDRLKNKNE